MLGSMMRYNMDYEECNTVCAQYVKKCRVATISCAITIPHTYIHQHVDYCTVQYSTV